MFFLNLKKKHKIRILEHWLWRIFMTEHDDQDRDQEHHQDRVLRSKRGSWSLDAV